LFPELAPWRRKSEWSVAPPKEKRIYSPSGRWSYANQVLATGTAIDTFINPDEVEGEMLDWLDEEDLFDHWRDDTVRGKVVFDADILIPTVYEGSTLWMSHTPSEMLSQRDGLRLAKGHTVVGGLGLGWLLARVAARDTVDRVTVIEQSEELVDWLLPRICSFLPKNKRIDIIVGDVNEVLPHLTADVALLDIWPEYGDVEEELYALRERIPRKQIRTIWGWGRGGPVV
jgi:hypothetical protein